MLILKCFLLVVGTLLLNNDTHWTLHYKVQSITKPHITQHWLRNTFILLLKMLFIPFMLTEVLEGEKLFSKEQNACLGQGLNLRGLDIKIYARSM